MKRFFFFLLLVLAAGRLPAHAEGPDDQYILIYGLIQAGDKLAASEPATAALPSYIEAQTALQQFQKVYPDWNPKVVNFRLNYIASKILSVTVSAAAAPPPAPKPALAFPTTPAPAPVAPTPSVPSEAERQLATVQEDLRRAQADKATLEAKLKESLAAQPTALDPRELAKAQQQIKDLMKENDLLKATVPAEKTQPAPTLNTRMLEENQRALDEANRNLREQTRRADALASERDILQRRLETLAPTADAAEKLAEVRKALETANSDLARQTELTQRLTSEKDTLQSQVQTLSQTARTVETLRAENETLKTQLAGAKATAASPSPVPELAGKLATAETRIVALQSDVDVLRLEKGALESRVQTLSQRTSTPPPASRREDLSRIKQLEDDRNELIRKLAAANKELSGRKGRASTTRSEALENQIATLRARIEIFEARAVPYTPEELALLDRPTVQLTAAAPRAGKRPISTLPSGVAAYVASAQRHFEAKEFDQAEADYLEILRRDESNAGTLANLATIQLERGHLDEAERNVKKALASAPNDAYSLSVLGYVNFRQQKFDDALDALSRAAQLSPQNAEIQNILGLTLSHKGLRGPAETALRKAIALDPHHASAHNNLAMIYLTQQPPAVELARWHYEKARAAGHQRNEELERLLKEKGSPPAASP